jgi:hypothetical protein
MQTEELESCAQKRFARRWPERVVATGARLLLCASCGIGLRAAHLAGLEHKTIGVFEEGKVKLNCQVNVAEVEAASRRSNVRPLIEIECEAFALREVNAEGVRSNGSSHQTCCAPASQQGSGVIFFPENRSLQQGTLT